MKTLLKLDRTVLDQYPLIDEKHIQELLEQAQKNDAHKIIVLDDDPTGVQTVHDISVYTDWTEASIRAGFRETNKLFYILTNSRSFTSEQTTLVHQEIGAVIAKVAAAENRPYLIISRGDSTLRGHYPLETDILRQQQEANSGYKIAGEILCPYFKEGGRFTIGNIHYVQDGEKLVPAGQTEFAKDKTFGYEASDLTEYIQEKTNGSVDKAAVLCISLEELRGLQFASITEKLLKADHFTRIVVNATNAIDVKIFCIALYGAIARGKKFLFRTAAGFVKEFGAISDKGLLSREEMLAGKSAKGNGGIIVIGSHTQKTTQQLENLKTLSDIEFIEFNSDLVLDDALFEQEIAKIVAKEENLIKQGKTVAVYTKRKLLELADDSKESALLRSVKISGAVQSLVGKLQITPAFVVAKGGITSSDVGVKALAVKKALVMGQIEPGIPVWRTGEDSKFPHIPYVIFPGNVGAKDTLKKVVEKLMG